MQAILLEQPQILTRTTTMEPQSPGQGEALVKIHRVGVCGTDYHAFDGKQPFFAYPRILGHELGVEIVEIGSDVQGLSKGDRCSVRPYLNCGKCPPCRRGKPNCCLNIQVFGVHVDGGMREYAVLPAAHLHRASSLTYDQLALVEPLAIGAHAVARAHLDKNERVLVVGAGPIGLAVIQFALLSGVQVSVMDISEQRLVFCRQLWPDVIGIDANGDVQAILSQHYGNDFPTAVFDATGNQQSMQNAFSYVGFGGRLIFVGLHQNTVTFPDPLFHSHEMTLLGSRNALAEDFTAIIAAMESETIHLMPWITHRATLDSFIEVFPQWLKPESGLIKGIISFTD